MMQVIALLNIIMLFLLLWFITDEYSMHQCQLQGGYHMNTDWGYAGCFILVE